jgi:hypothetical protein
MKSTISNRLKCYDVQERKIVRDIYLQNTQRNRQKCCVVLFAVVVIVDNFC